jgi:hypothetical protein
MQEYSSVSVSSELCEKLKSLLYGQYTLPSSNTLNRPRVDWQRFLPDWEKQNSTRTPSTQTLRNLLLKPNPESLDRICEQWVIDGLCQLLMNCPFEQATADPAASNTDIPTAPPDLLNNLLLGDCPISDEQAWIRVSLGLRFELCRQAGATDLQLIDDILKALKVLPSPLLRNVEFTRLELPE